MADLHANDGAAPAVPPGVPPAPADAVTGPPIPVLSYALPTIDAPPQTRLIVTHLADGGIRFVDPAAGFGGAVEYLAVTVIAVGFAVALCVEGLKNQQADDFFLSFACTVATVVAWRCAKHVAARETVIDVSAGVLSVQLPTVYRSRRCWAAANIWDVRAGLPSTSIHPPGQVCDLVILPRRRFPLRVLRNRNVAEVKWVVQELRRALGMRIF
jgi:hypothetical protein